MEDYNFAQARKFWGGIDYDIKTITPQPAQEPVAWRTFDGEGGYDYRAYDMNEHYAEEWNKRNPNHKGWVKALYATPPQRPWVGLTNEIIENIFQSAADADEETHIRFARAIEQHLKSKNT
jgi:hypothetical protein